jgi:phosphatidylserine/phosphatidylglycerophosphate/cardiolipin synthase-like enzyme
MDGDFQVTGQNPAALFTLKVHRGDGMALLAMNWKKGKPPKDFVGFAIEYKEPEPDGDRFYALKNRLTFPGADGAVNPDRLSTRLSPIQKFRWVHFPRNAELPGDFVYRVSPVFMNDIDELSYGEPQEATIQLRRETYPRKLNVTFTRGFVSSQAFVDKYASAGPISKLLPSKADLGLTFVATHPRAKEALAWMGFEARHAILEVLDQAIADKKANVRVVAYDLSEPDVVSRLEKLKSRLRIIIDDDGPHAKAQSGESQAAKRLTKSAGAQNVKRQHMGKLQHNKTIVVDGPKVQAVVCGSTNFTWRGFFVQSNNALILRGKTAVKPFLAAFNDYWNNETPATFGITASARWNKLGVGGIDGTVGFSPYAAKNALLKKIADDIGKKTTSSLFYSLAFLYQTPGVIRDAIKKVTKSKNVFVYGISDKKVGGIDLQKPDGNVAPVSPAALAKNVPEPFKAEPTGGGGNRMHHKFLVIDFDKPTARVYLGSYNFSVAADTTNGENLVLIRDRRIAVSYMIEALRIFDHYHFRVAQQEATARKKLQLKKPPRKPGEKPWWNEDYTNARKIRDRELFA